jgi:hypothetical protein
MQTGDDFKTRKLNRCIIADCQDRKLKVIIAGGKLRFICRGHGFLLADMEALIERAFGKQRLL